MLSYNRNLPIAISTPAVSLFPLTLIGRNRNIGLKAGVQKFWAFLCTSICQVEILPCYIYSILWLFFIFGLFGSSGRRIVVGRER